MGFLELASPSATTAPAQWIQDRLQGFAESVRSIVPVGFPGYARIFHPATRGDRPVRWSEIAAANGRRSHRMMQWPGIVGSWQFVHNDPQPEVWEVEPAEGTLRSALAARLVTVLRRHTRVPDDCYFGIWAGFGALPEEVRSAPAFDVPHRRYHLFHGPIAAAIETVEPPPWQQSPNLWWPADHDWCVATEIDFMTTYVACSRACLSDLLDDTDVEVVEAQPGDGVTWDSDNINRLPPYSSPG